MAFWYKGISIFEGAANANAIDSEVAVGVAFARVVASNDNILGRAKRQSRAEGILSIGKGNKPFKMYKFWSMKVLKAPKKGAEASLRPDEDRIFPFGHFIRKAKIDELPQLINILNGSMSIIGPRPVAEDQFDMFRYGKWNEAAKVPVGLSGPAALYDYIYGDQFTDEAEYMEKVYPTRRELEYTYVQKAGIFYDLKMIIYTVICICYALVGKECTWILDELKADAAKSSVQDV